MPKQEQIELVKLNICQLTGKLIQDFNAIPDSHASKYKYWKTPIVNNFFVDCYQNEQNLNIFSIKSIRKPKEICVICDGVKDASGREITNFKRLKNIDSILNHIADGLYPGY